MPMTAASAAPPAMNQATSAVALAAGAACPACRLTMETACAWAATRKTGTDASSAFMIVSLTE